MTGVVARSGESFEKMMRRFSKMVERSGVHAELKERERFVKPSVKKKLMKSQAIRRQKHALLEALK